MPTLALYGPDDHVIWRNFAEMCEVAFNELVGPFVVPRAGHFLQWERAELLNRRPRVLPGRPARLSGERYRGDWI